MSQLVYLTEPWAEAALMSIEGDEAVAKACKGLNISILTIITGAPEGRYGFFYAAFDGHGLSDYRVGYDYEAVTRGIDEPTFAVSGPYDVFAAMQRGDMGERKALLTGKLHLTGNLLKALRHMNAMEAVSAAMNRVDCAT